jgi:hypothetical protein
LTRTDKRTALILPGGSSSIASFDIGIKVVAVQEDAPSVATGVELPERDEVVDAVLAAAKSLGRVGHAGTSAATR